MSSPKSPSSKPFMASKSRKRSKGVLPKHRGAVVPAAETSYGQKVGSFPADSHQPLVSVAFEQHALNNFLLKSSASETVAADVRRQTNSPNCRRRSHETLINFLPIPFVVAAKVMRQTRPNRRKRGDEFLIRSPSSLPFAAAEACCPNIGVRSSRPQKRYTLKRWGAFPLISINQLPLSPSDNIPVRRF
jgi:hypothetical protein